MTEAVGLRIAIFAGIRASGCDGFYGASSMERLPAVAIREQVESFASGESSGNRGGMEREPTAKRPHKFIRF